MLIIKNIRTFKHWSVIPVSDLNIFTGPNSSGKSTVIKILQLFSNKKLEDAYTMASGEVSTIGFTCSWERFSSHELRDPLMQNLFAGSYIWRRSEALNGEVLLAYRNRFKRFTWLMELFEDNYGLRWGVYLFGDKQCIGQMIVGQDEDFIALNLSSDLYQNVRGETLDRIIEKAIEITPNCKSYKHDAPKESLYFQTKKNFKWKQPKYLAIRSSSFDYEAGPLIAFDEDWDDVGDKRDILIHLYSWFYMPVNYVSSLRRDIATVPPVRSIPSIKQLTFSDRNHADNHHHDWIEGAIYELIAEALKKNKSQYLSEVNDWLKKLLATDCALGGKVIKLIDPEPKYEYKANGSKAKIRRYSIELYLSVQNGVRVGFEDVGTGVSQVVPVVALLLSLDMNYPAILQQPELHLHPKAQSILADLLIETVGREHQLTVETHSEHIILRIIRRIVENSTHEDIGKKLNPNQLRLIYFHPLKHGSEPHWIRVDEHGDFLDPWPSGFFEERYEDLFFDRLQ